MPQTIDLQEGLHLRAVGTGAYEITHELPWPANSLLVEMADRTLVLVGTPYTPEATRRLLDWARSRFGEQRIVAINNGFHVDNLGGNSALRNASIPVYGSDLTVRLLHERGEKTRQRILEMIGNPALDNGLWTVTVDFGSGAQPATATFFATAETTAP